ncbi:MAG TPA: GNAT family protein [Polyangia bacterium]|nr:GNAT family protein [Polyangia bacterium]
MPGMRIDVRGDVYLSEFVAADCTPLVTYLADRAIYERTLRIPYPYREADADQWIALTAAHTRAQGRPIEMAVRESARGQLIGGVGFHDLELGRSHQAEIGYWLAKPYWGRGIMTAVVGRLVEIGFGDMRLLRLTAHVFDWNTASARVLEKNRFQLEGILRKHYHKDGRIFDGKLYARVRE